MRGGPDARPIFFDPTGRRWRRVRGITIVLAVIAVVGALLLAAAVLIPPMLPGVAVFERQSTEPGAAVTRSARERRAARRRLYASLVARRPAPAVRPEALRPDSLPLQRHAVSRAISAAFYVNWDEKSLVSLRAHAPDIDWLVCEWAFVTAGADSLDLRLDPRVLDLVNRLPKDDRPLVHLMVSNASPGAGTFDAQRAERFLANPAARRAAIRQLATAVADRGLGGVTLDLEGLSARAVPHLEQFATQLRKALPEQARLSITVGDQEAPALLDFAGRAADRVFVMLYDEHDAGSEAGPVASQAWFIAALARVRAHIPDERIVPGLGAYGYDWDDAGSARADEVTFTDAMKLAREHAAPVRFDPQSRNPYLTWTEPDSTDHVVWFLDAVTARNQVRAAYAQGVAGWALWRLGAEDPSLWTALHDLEATGAAGLGTIPAGYAVEFTGRGELLRIGSRPTAGRRRITLDSLGFVADETVDVLPTPWTVQRTGGGGHKVALTFDDGPDGKYTRPILDTLKSRGARATFFLIGEETQRYMGLVKRIVREGHDIGNHTFSHPDLSRTPGLLTRFELDAAERVFEGTTGRRPIFFRPPYFGDAEPTTIDELEPVWEATQLGYITAGLKLDPGDWQSPPAAEIIRRTMAARRATGGQVVLLHDGGGERSQTVKMLGALIDSLRANGDTVVPLSELAGLTQDGAMPPVPPSGDRRAFGEFLAFGTIGSLEWALHWLFLGAIALGVVRLAIVCATAIASRRRTVAEPVPSTWPSVTVVVPAYREEKVIGRTIESLLAQAYPGPLDVIVVDDGSPDDTLGAARAAAGNDPRVEVRAKPNGGKASALNVGFAAARGEVVVALDADTLFQPDTVRHLVAPFADPKVGAVAGNAKVGNRVNLITRWQAIEYITSQNLDRRAFALLDAITVVPGAVGAWRRDAVLAAGGFADETLAEDQDLTIALRRAGWRIAYAPEAIAWTEAPDTLRTLGRQRFRWSFGTLQCMWKHRGALFRRRAGTLGWLAMPHTWLFQLALPAVSPLADLLFAWSILSVLLVQVQHGATYAATRLESLIVLYIVFVSVDLVAALLALRLEPREDQRLAWLVALQRFVYRQLMYGVVVRSFVAAVRGGAVGWGKLERKATVTLPMAG